MDIQFLYFDGCPSHEDALTRLKEVMAEEKVEAEIDIQHVETEGQAHRLRFVGSPTILVEGQDIDPPEGDKPYGLACRVYRWEDGRVSPLPSPRMIRRALRRAKGSD